MVYYDDARRLNAEELRNLTDSIGGNPTVERLVFLQVLPAGGKPARLFPCFLNAWAEDEKMRFPVREGGGKWLMFSCAVVQCMDGEFTTVPVVIHETDLISRMCFWDKPPAVCRNLGMPGSSGWLQ